MSSKGAEIPNIDWAMASPCDNELYFDEWGNQVYFIKEEELPLDFQRIGGIYIRIKVLETNQSNLMNMLFYQFEIYKYLYNPDFKPLTNEIGYNSIVDCLDAAKLFIKHNRSVIDKHFSPGQPDIPDEPNPPRSETDIVSRHVIIPDDHVKNHWENEYFKEYKLSDELPEFEFEVIKKHNIKKDIFEK